MALAVATAACGSSNNNQSTMGCTRVASAEQLCMAQSCDLTWAEVEADQTFCSGVYTGCVVASCSSYHFISCAGLDWAVQYYFDATSGALVESAGWSQGMRTCRMLDTASIDLGTVSCAGPTAPPAWCAADGGTP